MHCRGSAIARAAATALRAGDGDAGVVRLASRTIFSSAGAGGVLPVTSPPTSHHGHSHGPDGQCRGHEPGAAPAGGPSRERDFGYCIGLVRRYDYDGYLCSLHLPAALRPAAFALRALDIELAHAVTAAREPSMGLLRLAWWRASLAPNAGVATGRPADHPVLRAVASVAPTARSTVARRWLASLIDAREAELHRGAGLPPSLAAVESSAQSTGGAVLCLTLDAAESRSVQGDHAATHAGAAAAMVGVLRATAAAARAGRVHLPADLLAASRVPEESILRGQPSEGLCDVVHAVASAAKGHLDAARGLAAGVPPGAARAALLPAVPASLYLSALERLRFNVFAPQWASRGGVSPAWTQAQLAWHAWRGTY